MPSHVVGLCSGFPVSLLLLYSSFPHKNQSSLPLTLCFQSLCNIPHIYYMVFGKHNYNHTLQKGELFPPKISFHKYTVFTQHKYLSISTLSINTVHCIYSEWILFRYKWKPEVAWVWTKSYHSFFYRIKETCWVFLWHRNKQNKKKVVENGHGWKRDPSFKMWSHHCVAKYGKLVYNHPPSNTIKVAGILALTQICWEDWIRL